MDKQNAKRAAAMAAATAVGSTGGTIGADAIINNNNVLNETEQSAEGNSAHTSSSNHGHSSSHVSPSTEPHVEVVSTSENLGQQNPEPTDPNIINEPVVEPVEPVTPVEPIVTVVPVDPIDPIEPIDPTPEPMYGGPDDPEPIIIPDPLMYGGPDDPLYIDPEGDVLMGVPAMDEEEIPTGEDTIIDDPSADYIPTDSGDVDYMA